MTNKICNKCNESKELKHFYKNKSSKLGVRPACIDCVSKVTKKYRNANKSIISEKKKLYAKRYTHLRRSKYLSKKYGITVNQYEQMFKNQNGSCAVCKSNSVKNTQHKHLHIDHCHKTGKIRGLLCGPCNAALGLLRDNALFFLEAAKYLESNGVCGI